MEFIIANSSRQDVAVLPEAASIDLEIGTGTNNDMQVVVNTSDYSSDIYALGNMVYAEGTEYGCIIGDMEVSTSEAAVTFTGDTWRGLLDIPIVEPPSGSAYRYVSGDLHTVMSSLLGNKLGALFAVKSAAAGVSVSNWKIDRYVSLLEAFEKMLASKNRRLDIKATGAGSALQIVLSAVPVVDHSEEVEVSQDSNLYFKIKKSKRVYNYMICAGRGELTERTIVYLHKKTDGSIEEVNSIPEGLDVRTYFYDNSSAESRDELISEAIKQFDEINETDSQEVSIDAEDDDYPIGDIVGGREYITGMALAEPIRKKIVKHSGNKLSIDYTVGEER